MSRYEDDPDSVNLKRIPGWLRSLLTSTTPMQVH
jgi:hypothetical protein